LFLSIGCEHNLPAGPAQVQQVQPLLSDIQAKIFTPKCATPACHVPNGTGPMSLQTGVSYTTLVGPGGTGVASPVYAPRLRANPGNANNSVLYLKVAGTLGSRMPLNQQPLSAAEISAIQTWINNGAQNN
jgi:hypothetical protein